MTVYSVNCGKFNSFKEANNLKKKLNVGGYVFTDGDCYTVCIKTTFKKNEAMDIVGKFAESSLDVWVSEKVTDILKEA